MKLLTGSKRPIVVCPICGRPVAVAGVMGESPGGGDFKLASIEEHTTRGDDEALEYAYECDREWLYVELAARCPMSGAAVGRFR